MKALADLNEGELYAQLAIVDDRPGIVSAISGPNSGSLMPANCPERAACVR